VDDEVLRAAMTSVDLEESLLDRAEDAQARVEGNWRRRRSGAATASTCGRHRGW
jgi:hypothetical protein